MRLRIEEDLGTANAVAGGPAEIGDHQVVEVLFFHEHGGALVVDVEEGLEIRELVGGAYLLDGGKRQMDVVPGGEFEHHLRLEGSLNVKMEFGLRQ